MDHEADGARNYDITNYNVLLDSTWGGDGTSAAGDRLRQMLHLQPPPTLLPPFLPLLMPMSRHQDRSQQSVEQETRADQSRAASRLRLKDRTSAGLFKVSCSSMMHRTYHHPRN
jgi:hypothetical protein